MEVTSPLYKGYLKDEAVASLGFVSENRIVTRTKPANQEPVKGYMKKNPGKEEEGAHANILISSRKDLI